MSDAGGLTAEDERAIEALVRRFAVLNDQGRYADMAPLFTENATFERPSAPGVPIVGRSEIIASFEARQPRVARHLICNSLVDFIGPNRAKVHSYSVLIVADPAGGGTASVGAFDDEVVREDDRWRFASRRGSSAIDGLNFVASSDTQ